jgi:hypothetical protein
MEGVPASHNPVLQEVLDLRPYINTSAAAIQESFSVERTYVVFRTLGLRHLVVVDRHNHVKGIVTRKVWQRVPALYVSLVVHFGASSCLDMQNSLPSGPDVLEIFFTLFAQAYALLSVAVRPLLGFWVTCQTAMHWSSAVSTIQAFHQALPINALLGMCI